MQAPWGGGGWPRGINTGGGRGLSIGYRRGVRIAVVIPALDEETRIEDAIASARAPDVEVVVADGGSRDATRARAEAAGARVVASAPGRARQLAAGVAGLEAETLLFLHADTRLPRGWAEHVREALADAAVAGGAFRLRFDRRSFGLRVVEWGAHLRVALLALPYGDQALFLRRSVLQALGGVPQVPLMEDLDLVAGIKRHGRLARLRVSAVTSARRYEERGLLATWLRNGVAAAAWSLGVDRERVAAWYRR